MKIENIMTSKDSPLVFQAFLNKDAPYLHMLHAFREISITHNEKMLQSKLENHGIPSMFVCQLCQ